MAIHAYFIHIYFRDW